MSGPVTISNPGTVYEFVDNSDAGQEATISDEREVTKLGDAKVWSQSPDVECCEG